MLTGSTPPSTPAKVKSATSAARTPSGDGPKPPPTPPGAGFAGAEGLCGVGNSGALGALGVEGCGPFLGDESSSRLGTAGAIPLSTSSAEGSNTGDRGSGWVPPISTMECVWPGDTGTGSGTTGVGDGAGRVSVGVPGSATGVIGSGVGSVPGAMAVGSVEAGSGGGGAGSGVGVGSRPGEAAGGL